MTEEWRPVVGFEKLYLVSNRGQVMRKVDRKLLKAQGTGSRYRAVALKNFDQCKRREVHRLVAEAFLGVRPGLVVNHKDHDRYNNCVDNLEWVTQAQNLAHAREAGRLHDHRLNGKFVAKNVHAFSESLRSTSQQAVLDLPTTTSGKFRKSSTQQF